MIIQSTLFALHKFYLSVSILSVKFSAISNPMLAQKGSLLKLKTTMMVAIGGRENGAGRGV